MTNYILPDGFTVDGSNGTAGTWNGFPVPILGPLDYADLQRHLLATSDDAFVYIAESHRDGYACDGLAWMLEQD